MKFIVSFLAVLAVTTAAPNYEMPTETRGLQEDLQEFRALIPKEKIIEVILDYGNNDAEVQKLLKFLHSDELEKMVINVNSEKSFINFLNYIHKCGLPIYRLFNQINQLLGLPLLTPPARMSLRRGKGINGLVADVSALIPADKLMALFSKKLKTSPEFFFMVGKMKSNKIINIVKEMMTKPSLQLILKKGKEQGVNLAFGIEILNKVFDWGFKESYGATFNYPY